MLKQKDGQFLYLLLLAITATLILLLHHVLADDAAVMAKLAEALDPTPSGWSGPDPCKWSGVDCDSAGKVTSVNLASKSLSGELPYELGQLSSLKSLNLQRNQLSGPLPPLSNLSSLEELSLDSNKFSSVPEDFLSGLTSLQTFSISDNGKLRPWTIPNSLGDSAALVSFIASKANIIGTIPDVFGSFPSLQNIRLSYNNITGSLPLSFAKSGIHNLLLNNQLVGLTGRIDVLGGMTELTQVWLHVNQFEGPIPDLSHSTTLFDLQLRDNLLTGPIPDSLTSLGSLNNVSLQNNNFQGPVPQFPPRVQVTLGTTNSFCNTSPGPCDPQVTTLLQVADALGYPMALAESWNGDNPCRGWKYIICDSGNVTVINFSNQNFVGTISPAIANLTLLRSLVLNGNKLTGTIPTSLTSLTNLQLLDVSNNNLSGQVPEFPNGVLVKTSGNPFIGVDLPPSSPPISSPNAVADNSGQSNEGKASVSSWVFAVIAVSAVIIIFLGFVYKQYVKPRENHEGSGNGKILEKIDSGAISSNSSSSTDFHVTEGISVSIPIGVLREVTNNFSNDNILGEGGFGIVYKGQLHDGTQIAVKRMESALNKKGLDEFRAEIEVLTKVRHRNLVALHGFCINGNERLLVYEYMPEGTLSQHLFHWHQKGTSPLNWTQRLSIALDVAKGVEYLHSLAQQCFIHRDLKPSNILLGDDMRAKVSDFGLVKSAPDGKYSLETRLAGTFGYLAPEYAATGRVTTKVDVFAFGVILMELITGKKALDDTLPEEKCHLVTWFRKVIINSEKIKSSSDPSLEPDEETFKSICKVAQLAGHCTAREPSQRPDMGQVVNVLSPLVVQWTPVSGYEEESFGIDLHLSLPQALQRWKVSEGYSTSDLFTECRPAYTTPSKGPSGVSDSF